MKGYILVIASVLDLIYIFNFINALIKIIIILCKRINKWYVYTTYLSLLILFGSRVGFFTWATITVYHHTYEELEKIKGELLRKLIVMVEIPKAVELLCIIFLVNINAHSHYESHFDIYDLQLKFIKKKKEWAVYTWVSSLCMLVVYFSYNLGYLFQSIKQNYYVVCKGLMNFLCISGAFMSILIKSIKLTGYLHRNEFHKEKCAYIDKVVIIWTIGRISEIFICIYCLTNLLIANSDAIDLFNFENYWNAGFMIVYVLNLIYSEFFATFYILGSKFIRFFEETDNPQSPSFVAATQFENNGLLTTIQENSRENMYDNTEDLTCDLNISGIDIKTTGKARNNARKKYRNLYINPNKKYKLPQMPSGGIKENQILSPKTGGTLDINIHTPGLNTVSGFRSVSVVSPHSEISTKFNKKWRNKAKKSDSLITASLLSSNDGKTYTQIINNDHKKQGSYSISSNYTRTKSVTNDKKRALHELTNDIMLSRSPTIKALSRKNGLGIVWFSKINNTLVTVREIDLKMSCFILNEIPNELTRLSKIDAVGIEIYKAQAKIGDKLLLISHYDESMISLTEFQDNYGKNLTYDDKLQLFYNIIKILEELSYQPTHKHHGHLTPNNILVNKDQTKILIIDIGFLFLKKYCGISAGYVNKSQYTSPEQLEEKGSVNVNYNEKSDVYSIAMIAWKIFTLQTPFEDLSLDNIKTYIVVQKNRPKLDSRYFSKDLSHLIRVCWQSDIENRPNFASIQRHLQSKFECLSPY